MTTFAAAQALGMEIAWKAAEVFTGNQRLSCELRLVGRLRERLLDPEPVLKARNITTVDGAAHVPHLEHVTDAVLVRPRLVACAVIGGDPPDPDAPVTQDRHALFEGAGWTLTGVVALPAGMENDRILDTLSRARFQLVRNAQIRADFGGRQAVWTLPETYVNCELAAAIYVG
jgi:hypothetical protein